MTIFDIPLFLGTYFTFGDLCALGQTSHSIKAVVDESLSRLFDQITPALKDLPWKGEIVGGSPKEKMYSLLNRLHDSHLSVKEVLVTKTHFLRFMKASERDQNLIALASRIEVLDRPVSPESSHIWDKMRPLFTGTVHEQAKSIRTWLQTQAGDLSTFHTLDLSNLNLTILPPELDKYFTNLRFLYLNGNKLTSIPNFHHLPNLHSLYLQTNRLKKIPNFTHLRRLSCLCLWENDLTEVPHFTHLSHLACLDLQDNHLHSVPDFVHFPHLHSLSLKNNNIKTLPSFSRLRNLQHLHIEGNDLTSLPIRLFPIVTRSLLKQRSLQQTICVETGYHIFQLKERSPISDIWLTMHDLNIHLGTDIRKIVIEKYNEVRPLEQQLPPTWDPVVLTQVYDIDIPALYRAFCEITDSLSSI